MPPGRVHLNGRLLIEAEQPKGHQKHVQQAGVVRILDVLEHQLPIAGYPLAQISQYDEFAPGKDTVKIAEHVVAEIGLEGRRLGRRAGEHDAVPAHDQKVLQTVLLRTEIGRHAALAAIAAAERDAEQIAREVVSPLMVRADELFRGAASDRAELGAAVSAPVDEDMDFAGGIAHGDDFFGAEPRAFEVAGLRDFGFETDIEPGRSRKNPLLLECEDVGIGIDPVGDAGASGLGPSAAGQFGGADRDRAFGSPIG